MEKIKVVLMITYSVWFVAFAFLVGKQYQKIGINYKTWLSITIIMTIIVVISFIVDIYHSKIGKN